MKTLHAMTNPARLALSLPLIAGLACADIVGADFEPYSVKGSETGGAGGVAGASGTGGVGGALGGGGSTGGTPQVGGTGGTTPAGGSGGVDAGTGASGGTSPSGGTSAGGGTTGLVDAGCGTTPTSFCTTPPDGGSICSAEACCSGMDLWTCQCSLGTWVKFGGGCCPGTSPMPGSPCSPETMVCCMDSKKWTCTGYIWVNAGPC